MATGAAAAGSRERLYLRLERRNRIVGVLRWLVPAAGALVLVAILALIAYSALSQRFGLSNLRIDRDNLVIDTPELTSTTEDGTRYAVSARAARIPTGQGGMIGLDDFQFTVDQPDGGAYRATAPEALLQANDQLLNVPGTTTVSGPDGFGGTIDGMFADMIGWTMSASGKVDFTLPGGGRLTSDGMTYDRNTAFYTFSNVTVELPMIPGPATGDASP